MIKILTLALAGTASALAVAVPATLAGGLMLTAGSGGAEAKVRCYTRYNHKICRGVPDPMPPKPDPKGQKMK